MAAGRRADGQVWRRHRRLLVSGLVALVARRRVPQRAAIDRVASQGDADRVGGGRGQDAKTCKENEQVWLAQNVSRFYCSTKPEVWPRTAQHCSLKRISVQRHHGKDRDFLPTYRISFSFYRIFAVIVRCNCSLLFTMKNYRSNCLIQWWSQPCTSMMKPAAARTERTTVVLGAVLSSAAVSQGLSQPAGPSKPFLCSSAYPRSGITFRAPSQVFHQNDACSWNSLRHSNHNNERCVNCLISLFLVFEFNFINGRVLGPLVVAVPLIMK